MPRCSSASTLVRGEPPQRELRERRRDSFGPERWRLVVSHFRGGGGARGGAAHATITAPTAMHAMRHGRWTNTAGYTTGTRWTTPAARAAGTFHGGEWTVMTDNLGGSLVAGGYMKTTTGGMEASTVQTRAVFQVCRAAFASTMGSSKAVGTMGTGGVPRSMAPFHGAVVTTPVRLPSPAMTIELTGFLFVAFGMPCERSERVLVTSPPNSEARKDLCILLC